MSRTPDPRSFPVLRRGARGDAVITLQRRLCIHFQDLDDSRFVDGAFGPATEFQVRRLQRRDKLSVDGVVGRNTWTALLSQPAERVPSPAGRTARTPDRTAARTSNDRAGGGGALAERVFRTLRRKNYAVHDEGAFDLNLVGVRSTSSRFDHFDDRLVLVYRDDSGKQVAAEYPITTDPGSYYTQTRLLNEAGVAILIPGQYRDTYLLGKHQGRYEALVQRGGKVKIWRDPSRTDELNRSGRVYEGWFGINIHRARTSGTTARVGSHSAGCQVFQRADDFAFVISLAKKSAAIRANRFTYTLLEEADLR